MRSFDSSVEEFENTVQERMENLASKHTSELSELLRLRRSYRRLTKRNNANSNWNKTNIRMKLKNAATGFSNI